ncbi:hypothetical protein FV232_01070 [Methylobacterium sp. WL30]|uniref:hypothetical protein n=1 Tax=unclassified Methylobacterium TaxID=2615210 RepID=UPI0011CC59B7|nr:MULTISPECIES: hypothetical protein [unclassified Methylobacterium]TXN38749.1 hypothetical protein FV225_12660 [Methylobacterium sp. WL93]TXN52243.1 hypothetical protein FV227_04100 [Methylobacterium sp. WL119]TXN70674.1 hypothetical protein FV232_01070 [Methylobacterium sp. WL30]
MPSFTATDPRDASGDACLEVEFTIDHHGSAPQTYGPPENCDPGEAPEITIDEARDSTGADVLSLLTPDQYEAIETKILEDYDFTARDEYYDGDY